MRLRDEKAIDSCHRKSSVGDKQKPSYKKEIMWGIYETRKSGIFKKCIADVIDSDGFHTKLFSLQPPWEELCCGFYNWFLIHRKKEFLQSVNQSARKDTKVMSLLCQNDIESFLPLRNTFSVSRCLVSSWHHQHPDRTQKKNEELLVLCIGGRYVLLQDYKKWYASIWHSGSPERREQHIKDFQVAAPNVRKS